MNIEERFLKYVSYDTQSDEYSNTTPSTLKQLELGKVLVKEMLEIGIDDAHLDEYGIVYGTIKGNGGTGDIIGFIAHMINLVVLVIHGLIYTKSKQMVKIHKF